MEGAVKADNAGKPKRSSFRKVWNVITSVVAAAAVILAILLVGVRLVGLTPYAVISPSMTPAYPVGSMIYVKKCDPASVKVGDPITFRLSGSATVVTHRVTKVDLEDSSFTTKGDANNTEDGAPVRFADLIGKPVFSIPLLGALSGFISKPPGTYAAIGACVVILIMFLLPDFINRKEKAGKTEKE